MTKILTLNRFKIIDREPRPVASPDPNRDIHVMVTISSGLREFILLQDFKHPEDIWLNEVIGAHIEEVKDDELFKELWDFLCKEKVLMIYANQEEDKERQRRLRN